MGAASHGRSWSDGARDGEQGNILAVADLCREDLASPEAPTCSSMFGGGPLRRVVDSTLRHVDGRDLPWP